MQVLYSSQEMDSISLKLARMGAYPISKWTKKTFLLEIEKKGENSEKFKKWKLDVMKDKLLVSIGYYPTNVYGNHVRFYKLIDDFYSIEETAEKANHNPTSGVWECSYYFWNDYKHNQIPEKRSGIATIRGMYAYFDNGDVKRTDSKGFIFRNKIS